MVSLKRQCTYYSFPEFYPWLAWHLTGLRPCGFWDHPSFWFIQKSILFPFLCPTSVLSTLSLVPWASSLFPKSSPSKLMVVCLPCSWLSSMPAEVKQRGFLSYSRSGHTCDYDLKAIVVETGGWLGLLATSLAPGSVRNKTENDREGPPMSSSGLNACTGVYTLTYPHIPIHTPHTFTHIPHTNTM